MWAPEMPLRREDNAEASGHLVISSSQAEAAEARAGARGARAARARPPGGSGGPCGSWSSSFGCPGLRRGEPAGRREWAPESGALRARQRVREAGGPHAQAAMAPRSRSRGPGRGAGAGGSGRGSTQWSLGSDSCTSPGDRSQVRQGALPRLGHGAGGRQSSCPRSAGARSRSAGGGAHPSRPARAPARLSAEGRVLGVPGDSS